MKISNNTVINESALNVLKQIYRFKEIIKESAERYAPNSMCKYLYELSQNFNTFYNDSPIMTENDEDIKEFRLTLTDSVRQVIKNGLYLLGIEAVDKM